MPSTTLYELFKDFNLTITQDEIDIIYKVANHQKISIDEAIHTSFLMGLSSLLYKIRQEEISGSCCGDGHGGPRHRDPYEAKLSKMSTRI